MTFLFIFLTPLINFFLFELFFFKTDLFYAVLIITSLLLLIAVRKITNKKFTEKEFWNFSLWPVIFSGALSAYSLLLTNRSVIQALFVLNFLLVLYYLKNVYRGERNEFLENISAYGNFLTAFFIFATIYGLRAFLNIQVWLLILAAVVAMIFIVYQIFWANKATMETSAVYIFITCLILTQLSWVLYFLPFNFNALGLLMAICYYVLIGVVKSYWAGKLTARSLKLYLASGLGGILLVLLTAKWI